WNPAAIRKRCPALIRYRYDPARRSGPISRAAMAASASSGPRARWACHGTGVRRALSVEILVVRRGLRPSGRVMDRSRLARGLSREADAGCGGRKDDLLVTWQTGEEAIIANSSSEPCLEQPPAITNGYRTLARQ